MTLSQMQQLASLLPLISASNTSRSQSIHTCRRAVSPSQATQCTTEFPPAMRESAATALTTAASAKAETPNQPRKQRVWRARVIRASMVQTQLAAFRQQLGSL